MNNDFISRSEAIKVFDDYVCDIPPMEVIDEIRCLPAVDAEPVRHAKWVEKGMSLNMLSVWECSKCNLKLDGKTWLYCPNCGARMDTEEA